MCCGFASGHFHNVSSSCRSSLSISCPCLAHSMFKRWNKQINPNITVMSKINKVRLLIFSSSLFIRRMWFQFVGINCLIQFAPSFRCSLTALIRFSVIKSPNFRKSKKISCTKSRMFVPPPVINASPRRTKRCTAGIVIMNGSFA
jgi:hypothetical protein